jgi:hypothetical protein
MIKIMKRKLESQKWDLQQWAVRSYARDKLGNPAKLQKRGRTPTVSAHHMILVRLHEYLFEPLPGFDECFPFDFGHGPAYCFKIFLSFAEWLYRLGSHTTLYGATGPLLCTQVTGISRIGAPLQLKLFEQYSGPNRAASRKLTGAADLRQAMREGWHLP